MNSKTWIFALIPNSSSKSILTLFGFDPYFVMILNPFQTLVFTGFVGLLTLWPYLVLQWCVVVHTPFLFCYCALCIVIFLLIRVWRTDEPVRTEENVPETWKRTVRTVLVRGKSSTIVSFLLHLILKILLYRLTKSLFADICFISIKIRSWT